MKLPISKYTVTLLPYVPQRVFEKYQETITKNIKMDMNLHVTVDTVAEKLGADRASAIQNAQTDDERRILLDDARKEIMMQGMKAEINLADNHAAEREKMIGMIKELKDGDTVLDSKEVENLPQKDYALIQAEIAKIEAQEEEGKSQGQSDA
jgi:predicted RND superfamily exporter protein